IAWGYVWFLLFLFLFLFLFFTANCFIDEASCPVIYFSVFRYRSLQSERDNVGGSIVALGNNYFPNMH
ncbi:MAG: hypothetical protein P8171_25535, partial [Candidatus Thiodiazotropha sp.]